MFFFKIYIICVNFSQNLVNLTIQKSNKIFKMGWMKYFLNNYICSISADQLTSSFNSFENNLHVTPFLISHLLKRKVHLVDYYSNLFSQQVVEQINGCGCFSQQQLRTCGDSRRDMNACWRAQEPTEREVNESSNKTKTREIEFLPAWPMSIMIIYLTTSHPHQLDLFRPSLQQNISRPIKSISITISETSLCLKTVRIWKYLVHETINFPINFPSRQNLIVRL